MFVNYGCPRNSAIERWRYDLSHLHKIAMDCWPTMFRKMKALLVCLVLLMPVSAVAQDGDTQDGEDSVRNQALQEDLLKSGNNGGYSDPFAPVNERMLKFNLKLDDYVLRPVATGYASITSEPVRAGVGRFLDNIKVIPYVANNLFQLRFAEAGSDLARFGINSTLGLAGFFDPAAAWFGLRDYPDDFGLTLRYYGVPAGPYLMLPVMGPSTVTDLVGTVADNAMNPVGYLVPWYIDFAATVGRRAVDAVNYRAQHLDQFEEADLYAVDLYGAVQDAYLQRRAYQLKELQRAEVASSPPPPQWILIRAPSLPGYPSGSLETPQNEWLRLGSFGTARDCDNELEKRQSVGDPNPLDCLRTGSPEYADD